MYRKLRDNKLLLSFYRNFYVKKARDLISSAFTNSMIFYSTLHFPNLDDLEKTEQIAD